MTHPLDKCRTYALGAQTLPAGVAAMLLVYQQVETGATIPSVVEPSQIDTVAAIDPHCAKSRKVQGPLTSHEPRLTHHESAGSGRKGPGCHPLATSSSCATRVRIMARKPNAEDFTMFLAVCVQYDDSGAENPSMIVLCEAYDPCIVTHEMLHVFLHTQMYTGGRDGLCNAQGLLHEIVAGLVTNVCSSTQEPLLRPLFVDLPIRTDAGL